jgi:hypothetical protein
MKMVDMNELKLVKMCPYTFGSWRHVDDDLFASKIILLKKY